MNDIGFDFEDQDFADICGLADIFPDIEPYLEDVTNSYEVAKVNINKRKNEGHVDGSDSDSGISADSYPNGIFKTVESTSVLPENKSSKSIPVIQTINVTDKNNSNESNQNNKIIIKRAISYNNELPMDVKPSIYKIIPKGSNSSFQNLKPIFLKSNALKSNETNKESSKSISKITPIKLLKTNDGFPIIINNDNIKKCETILFNDTQKTVNSKEDNLFSTDNISLNSRCNMKGSFEKKEDSLGEIFDEMSDCKTSDCQAYFEMLNSSQNLGNKVLQTSSLYNNLSNCDGVLDVHNYDRMIKKQERMIKNRQAASLSRQRKKEYVERLEHKVEQQKQENHYIQNQINDMRERFCAMEQENRLLKRDIQTWRERYYDLERQKIKQGIITSNKNNSRNNEVNNKNKFLKATAASTTILGFFIILTFNFNSLNSSISSLYKSQDLKSIPIYQSNYPTIQNSMFQKKIGKENRLGRTLFSIIENSSILENANLASHICNNSNGLNVSETLRLTRELNTWGSRFKAESVKVYDRLQNKKMKSQILSKEMELINKKSKLGEIPKIINKIRRKRNLESGQLEIYLKNNYNGFLDGFIDEIDRKPDTLYFVTFHSDNLIFPASNMNKNLSAPKITLLLPADINQKDKHIYKMMKIDCQVQNFTIVNLKKIKEP